MTHSQFAGSQKTVASEGMPSVATEEMTYVIAEDMSSVASEFVSSVTTEDMIFCGHIIDEVS